MDQVGMPKSLTFAQNNMKIKNTKCNTTSTAACVELNEQKTIEFPCMPIWIELYVQSTEDIQNIIQQLAQRISRKTDPKYDLWHLTSAIYLLTKDLAQYSSNLVLFIHIRHVVTSKQFDHLQETLRQLRNGIKARGCKNNFVILIELAQNWIPTSAQSFVKFQTCDVYIEFSENF